MAANATFALKAGEWFRRGRLLIVSPDSRGTACPLSGRNSTYRLVQILEAGSRRRLLLRRVRGLAALSQNDPGKSNGLMAMDAASKVKSASDVSTWHAMTADGS